MARFEAFGLVLFVAARITFTRSCSDCRDEVAVPCTITTMHCNDECVPQSEGLTPGKVENAAIKNYVRNGQLGFNVSFSLPKDASRDRLRGIVVKIMRLQDADQSCYCVNISKAHCIPTELYPELHVDCSIGWKDKSSYSIIIQSLPSSEANFVQLHNIVGNVTGPNLNDPCQWEMVSYTYRVTSESINGPWDITIKYDFAPKAFKFRKYFFKLMSNNDSNECSFKDFIQNEATVVNFDLEDGTGTVKLRTPYTGDQCILMMPTCGEDFWWQCEEHKSNCSDLEPQTRIRININATAISKRLLKRGSIHQDYSRFAPGQSEKDSCNEEIPLTPPDNDVIVAIVLPIVIIGVSVIGAGIYFYKRRRGSTNIPNDPVKTSPKGGRSVLLIHSNDFKAHETAVLKLASFLNKQCGLHILCHLLDDKASDNQYHWMLDSMEKADKVLIIHSQGTYIRYKCQRQCLKLTDNIPSPHHDLFDIFVQHLISKYIPRGDWKTMGKFINARFQYTDVKYVVDDFMGQASVYVLMDHLKDLVAKLYDMTSHSEHFHLDNLDWDKQNSIVDNAKKYLKTNPKWFTRKFATEAGNSINQDSVLENVTAMQKENDIDDNAFSIVTVSNTVHSNTANYNQESVEFDSGFQDLGGVYTVSLPTSHSHHSEDRAAADIYEYLIPPQIDIGLNSIPTNVEAISEYFHPPNITRTDDVDDDSLLDFSEKISNINSMDA